MGISRFRGFVPDGFVRLTKIRAQKWERFYRYTKFEGFNKRFRAFTKFLQFFDHFIVEIFAGLDYNKNRKSEEGPRAEYRVG